jgi:hypothetical protein
VSQPKTPLAENLRRQAPHATRITLETVQGSAGLAVNKIDSKHVCKHFCLSEAMFL